MMKEFNEFMEQTKKMMPVSELRLVEHSKSKALFIDPVYGHKIIAFRGIDPKTRELRWFFRVVVE